MNVNLTGKNFYKNQLLHKGLEFAANKGYLFHAGASLALSTVARPLSILAAPKTDKENKKLACAKSISSSAGGFLLMFAASMPLSRSIRKIDKNPMKYLKPETIKKLSTDNLPLVDSKAYQFATQIFKLGLGLIIAVPKSIMTCALIPPIMNKLFKKDSSQQVQPKSTKNLSFKGGAKLDPLSKNIGKIIDNPKMIKFADKFKNSNYEMHIPALTDTLATGAFVYQTKKSKKIEEKRKNILNNNAVISTGLSLIAGYVLDKATQKPTEKFIKNFSEANKGNPKLGKYIEGIRIVKPALILGSIYYIAIPMISTFFAERISKK